MGDDKTVKDHCYICNNMGTLINIRSRAMHYCHCEVGKVKWKAVLEEYGMAKLVQPAKTEILPKENKEKEVCKKCGNTGIVVRGKEGEWDYCTCKHGETLYIRASIDLFNRGV